MKVNKSCNEGKGGKGREGKGGAARLHLQRNVSQTLLYESLQQQQQQQQRFNMKLSVLLSFKWIFSEVEAAQLSAEVLAMCWNFI